MKRIDNRGGQVRKGLLTGQAISMTLGRTDHTYVISDAGHIWPCFGRGNGGIPICSGVGNIDEADCLSKPQSQAGIRYARTGLCYQASNRILYPAGQTVSAARGYQWFVFAYGTYGKDLQNGFFSPQHHPWPELVACAGHTVP